MSTPTSQQVNHPEVLVLFSGGLLGFEDAVASLGRLVTRGWSLDWIQTPSASRILDQEVIASAGMTAAGTGLVRSHEALVLPTMTVNLAAKVAHGIGDCLASNVMAEFIMSNKPVVASISAICPDSPEKQSWFPEMPGGYATMLRENLARLASFGVSLTPARELDVALTEALRRNPADGAAPGTLEYSGKVLTKAALAGLPVGSTLQVAPTTRVTALAEDAARERRITLSRG